MKKKVLVLGSSGMLGWKITRVFCKNSDFDVSATLRDLNFKENLGNFPRLKYLHFDGENPNHIKKLNPAAFDWIINAIGIIKPYIKENQSQTVNRAIKINALLPHLLFDEIKNTKTKIIQIATDCVFSGTTGKYDENSSHDALDAYGKTKSLGEVHCENFYNLRCSIIGHELKGKLSLLEWFLAQEKNAEIYGFTNHLWNGITTLAFAKICKAVIENDLNLPNLQHIIPSDILTKFQMLEIFAKAYKRKDIKIIKKQTTPAIDRTLATLNSEINEKIWHLAGYKSPPSIKNMIEEMSNL